MYSKEIEYYFLLYLDIIWKIFRNSVTCIAIEKIVN